ncbi:5939_t:CDS:1 [Paraglomus brasilianum]|uniref:5939_t:CDS:1 n=1 Tax=Paraglomus brasilianum TaxID=144538 RepID=A0A9N8WKC0_9GLOM|nr:5939_t:CDS:1 [Paraglomus brasilianum]
MQASIPFLVSLGLVAIIALVIYGYTKRLKRLRIDSSLKEYTIIQGAQENLSANIQAFKARIAKFEKRVSNYQQQTSVTDQYVVDKEDSGRREKENQIITKEVSVIFENATQVIDEVESRVQQLEEKKALLLGQLRKDGAIEKVDNILENKRE